jgi:hypothetical protein
MCDTLNESSVELIDKLNGVIGILMGLISDILGALVCLLGVCLCGFWFWVATNSDWRNKDLHIMFSVVYGLISSLTFLAFAYSVAKVVITPKLYLLEYAFDLTN